MITFTRYPTSADKAVSTKTLLKDWFSVSPQWTYSRCGLWVTGAQPAQLVVDLADDFNYGADETTTFDALVGGPGASFTKGPEDAGRWVRLWAQGAPPGFTATTVRWRWVDLFGPP